MEAATGYPWCELCTVRSILQAVVFGLESSALSKGQKCQPATDSTGVSYMLPRVVIVVYVCTPDHVRLTSNLEAMLLPNRGRNKEQDKTTLKEMSLIISL